MDATELLVKSRLVRVRRQSMGPLVQQSSRRSTRAQPTQERHRKTSQTREREAGKGEQRSGRQVEDRQRDPGKSEDTRGGEAREGREVSDGPEGVDRQRQREQRVDQRDLDGAQRQEMRDEPVRRCSDQKERSPERREHRGKGPVLLARNQEPDAVASRRV